MGKKEIVEWLKDFEVRWDEQEAKIEALIAEYKRFIKDNELAELSASELISELEKNHEND